MPSDAALSSAKRRLHPLSVLFLLARQLRQFAVPVLLALVLGSRSRETAWQIYALPVLIPYALVLSFLLWRKAAVRGLIDRPIWIKRKCGEPLALRLVAIKKPPQAAADARRVTGRRRRDAGAAVCGAYLGRLRHLEQ